MNGHASPATQLHDVRVVNEQTGAAWYPAAATIEAGAIVIRLAARGTTPPAQFFARRAATFPITATDGGGRSRHFPHAAFAADRSEGRTFIFR